MSQRRIRGFRGVTRLKAMFLAALCAACVVPATGLSEMIHSNGYGGGPWSDPQTWHGGAVPGPDDSVVIAMRDIVVFDRDDSERISCGDLFIDPEGVLTFAPTDQPLVLRVNGSIESWGVLRLNGVDSPRGFAELQVLSTNNLPRRITLLEKSSLLVYGHEHVPDGSKNARIVSHPMEEGQSVQPLMIRADGRAMIDVHQAWLADTVVTGAKIDNTGAKATERLNLIGNVLTGQSRIDLAYCDTAVVRNNRFEAGVPGLVAVRANRCKLTEIRGNRAEGPYAAAFQLTHDVDSAVAENVVYGSDKGIYVHGHNTMVKDNYLCDCKVGVELNTANAVVENVIVEKAETAFRLVKATGQITSCRAVSPAPKGTVLALEDSAVNLLNCDFDPTAVVMEGEPPEKRLWAECMQYLVARVTGRDPGGVQVHVQTAKVSGGVPAGKADLNVRNAPAWLSPGGLTPLPKTLQCLTLRSWRIGRDKQIQNAPFYDLIVTGPPPAEGKPRPTLKKELIEPTEDWYRPEPNAPESTLEIDVK